MEDKSIFTKDKNSQKLPSLAHEPLDKLKPSSVIQNKKTTI